MDYKVPPEFEEDSKNPLLGISLTESTELWLIQWPINQHPDFDGQELSLKLHHDGQLGSFEGSSGKSYEVVSFAAQEPDATVFLSSASDSKVVGKISRRVSLVHYPEPSELEKSVSNRPGQRNQRFGGTSSMQMGSTQGSRQRSSRSVSRMSHGMVTPTHSSGKSLMFDSGEPSKRPKKRHVDEPMRSMDHSTLDSEGREGRSDVTSIGSAGYSREGKSKMKIKDEE